ncbi:MAG: hypothetical protein WBL23_01760 [Salinisphaera sp.]|uniref:hypothetical protein n=1 Tax=Salinisphaera sp. TaxID=1914330 RepID=UPI003C7E265F
MSPVHANPPYETGRNVFSLVGTRYGSPQRRGYAFVVHEADTEISMVRMRQGRSISRSRVVAGLDALLFLAALSPRRFALLTHRF